MLDIIYFLGPGGFFEDPVKFCSTPKLPLYVLDHLYLVAYEEDEGDAS